MGIFSVRRFVLLTHCLSLARAVPPPLILSTNAINSSDLDNTPNSTLAAVIPNDFTIRPSLPLLEPILNRRYTLSLTLHVLGSLARDDFNEAQQTQAWRSQQQVAIEIVGPARALESPLPIRKYAVWGIYKAIHLMVARSDFQARNYELFWQGALVGYVAFNNGDYGALGIGSGIANSSGTAIQQGNLSALSNPLPNAAMTNIGADRVTLSYELNGRTIGESNVFMTLFTGMLKAAPYSKNERVDDFFVNSRPFNSLLSFKGEDGSHPRGRYFAYEHLIELFNQFPQWVMSHRGRWTEAHMVVSIDDEVVGAGLLKWQIRQSISGGDGGNVLTW